MNNVNPKTGIRYGVTNASNYPELYNEIIDHGTNETYENYKKECVEELRKWFLDHDQNDQDAEELAEDAVGSMEIELPDESRYIYTDEEGNEFILDYLGGCPLIWCIKTNQIVAVKSLCSSCVSGAGDLDSGIQGIGFQCYGVPECWTNQDEQPVC